MSDITPPAEAAAMIICKQLCIIATRVPDIAAIIQSALNAQQAESETVIAGLRKKLELAYKDAELQVGGGWKPMDDAPKDGVVIEGLYDSGPILIRWAERRQCMLAGVGGGNGYFGPGWEDDFNHLIMDPPMAWREEDWEDKTETTIAELRSACAECSLLLTAASWLDSVSPKAKQEIENIDKRLSSHGEPILAELATLRARVGKLAEFRDCVLNGRNQLEAPCLDNDQTNAVLALFDDCFPSTLPKEQP